MKSGKNIHGERCDSGAVRSSGVECIAIFDKSGDEAKLPTGGVQMALTGWAEVRIDCASRSKVVSSPVFDISMWLLLNLLFLWYERLSARELVASTLKIGSPQTFNGIVWAHIMTATASSSEALGQAQGELERNVPPSTPMHMLSAFDKLLGTLTTTTTTLAWAR
jgi:hypothetical protein